MTTSANPINVFLSYAHEDERLMRRLESHLSSLKREGLISTWYNRQIEPDAHWAGVIDRYLEQASLILLLVSADFLASDYCYQIEVKRALERHQSGEAIVIPIVVRPTDWGKTPFAHLQALPTGSKAITDWSNQDQAFVDVVLGIRKVVESLASLRPAGPKTELRPPEEPKPSGQGQGLTGRRKRSARSSAQSKYNVQIGEGTGNVIGDNAHVEQHFYYGPVPEQPVNLAVAEETYRQKVVDAYNWLDFSGFDTSDLSLANVPLEDVFVRLTLTRTKALRESVPGEELSRGESQQQKRVITVQEPIELGEALSDHVLLVGEPGGGKSTLLRWLAVTFARQYPIKPDQNSFTQANWLPVLVELGHLPDRYLRSEGGESPNWLQFLPEYLPTRMGFTNTPLQLLAQALTDGRCLLLFDGLDEIADRQARMRIARSLAELAHLRNGNRVIVGSRSAGISESEGALRPRFQRCQIERFTSEDVQRFFRFWYALDDTLSPEHQRDAADALYARVQSTPALLQLATTPLLSTILLLIWRNEGDLPERRVDLYERCCRILIENWEAHHDVAYQGELAGMDWEEHLNLLTPLAYAIHSQEQRVSATKDELVPLLTLALQKTARYHQQTDATRGAKIFLNMLSLRSGLLQRMGDGRFGFPHQTFQEYLTARFIATRSDSEYIDLVMEHLHEGWWREVHLLTIAYLGSEKVAAGKASALLLAILRVYGSPCWILRAPTGPSLLRVIGLGMLFPQLQLEERLAWKLDREFEMVIKGYSECIPDKTTARVDKEVLTRAVLVVRGVIYDTNRYGRQNYSLLPAIFQLSQRQGNEKPMKVLLKALYSTDVLVRMRAAQCLIQMGAGNEIVMKAFLETLPDRFKGISRQILPVLEKVGVGDEAVARALSEVLRHDSDWAMRSEAAKSLGKVGVSNEAIRETLLEAMHDSSWVVRREAAESLGQIGVGDEAVVKALLEALHDPAIEVRRGAAESLGQVGMGDEMAWNALQEALGDPDEYVRKLAAISLGQLGASSESAIEALSDPDESIRRVATVILGQVGVGDETVVVALLEAMHDSSWVVRREAAESLGKTGVGDETVVVALLDALHDPVVEVRRKAAESLGQVGVGDEAVVRALLEAEADDPGWAAERSLRQIAKNNQAVVKILLELLNNADEKRRLQLAVILGEAGASNEMVVRILLEALRGKHLSREVVESLGGLEIREVTQLRRVLIALNRCLHEDSTHGAALVSIRRLLDGRPIPGYRWIRSRKQRTIHRLLKSLIFWLSTSTIIVMIGLVILLVVAWMIWSVSA